MVAPIDGAHGGPGGKAVTAHVGYVLSGRMAIRMDDGEEGEVGPGDFMQCDAGHDAWVVGEEPCVIVDWQGYADYAKANS